MKKLVVFFSISLFFTACGPDSQLVADGTSHACKLKELNQKLAADPDNKEIKDDIIQYTSFLNDIVDHESEGNKEALKEAIKKGAENCK